MISLNGRMRRVFCLGAAFLLLAGAGAAAARDMAAIRASGKLVVALPNARTPPFFFEEGGELKGLDIDLAKSLAQALGVRAVFRNEAKSFNHAVEMVARGEADISAAKLSRTLARAQGVLFSDPYVELPHALLVNRLRFAGLSGNKPVIQTLQQYSGTIGVIAQSSFVGYARSNFPKATVVEFDSWDAAVDAVIAGRVTAVYRDAFEIKRVFKIRPDLALTVRSIIIEDIVDSIGIAVGADNYHLHSFVNLFLQQKKIRYSAGQILSDYEKHLH